jgi:hypothetical protein
MGVDLEGSRARAAKAKARPQGPPDGVDFSQMTPDEVRDYWAAIRASRLGRTQGRQDDEVAGIAVFYLAATAAILGLAVLSNLAG